jgi:quinoprotein dehydrogenase-associated probable ABC transporter substrate-binding protein
VSFAPARRVGAARLMGTALALALALAAPGARAQFPGSADKTLRVCDDPNNLPLSNDKREGFQNKIAALLAEKLGWKVEYTFFPQRMGFIRNTLRAREPNSDRYKCDLVMGVPVGFELAAATQPYYRSTYVMVFKRGKGLDGVKTPDDLLRLDPGTLKSLKLGAFQASPPTDWLLRNKLIDQATFFQLQSGDPAAFPGEIITRDLAGDRIDIAMVWGPIGGYFARTATPGDYVVVPFAAEESIKFDFPIAMGVRFGEKEWKAEVERLLRENRSEIDAILLDYGVPLVDDKGQPIRPR